MLQTRNAIGKGLVSYIFLNRNSSMLSQKNMQQVCVAIPMDIGKGLRLKDLQKYDVGNSAYYAQKCT